MLTFKTLLLVTFLICFFICAYQFLRIFLYDKTKESSQARGKISAGIRYSLTAAMSPFKKETAYRHLPTYTGGIIYHVGTFLSFLLLALHFFSIQIPTLSATTAALILGVSSLSGAAIFLKRITNPKLQTLSNADDYFSNLLVTGFQIISALTLLYEKFLPILFLYGSLLFLYIPLGKLKHTVYFFASRIHLGIFFGRRGVWPLKRQTHR